MEKIQTPLAAGVGGAAVLAALLSFGGGDSKKPVPPQNPSTTAQSTNDDASKGAFPNQEGPWRAVCEEFAPNGIYPANPQSRERGYSVVRVPNSPEGAVELTTKDKNGYTHRITVHKQLLGNLVGCIPPKQLDQVRLIIATVPDPDKTEMRLEFDRYIEAIERAAAIRGFHYTGYWFPWAPRQTGPPPRKEDEVEVALLRAEQPGILVFHNDVGERLLIFVVGETPTSGINRTQMTQALSYRQSLLTELQCETNASKVSQADLKACRSADVNAQRDKNVPQIGNAAPPYETGLSGPLRISGPHFSGGLTSLGEVLYESGIINSSSSDQPTVRILSPDVSSKDLIEAFRKFFCKDAKGCTFTSISNTSATKDDVVLAYLANLGYESNQVAELIEDESGFGDSALRPDTVSPPASTPSAPISTPNLSVFSSNAAASTISTSAAKAPAPAAQPSDNILKLTFPRELSAARTLSDQQSEELAASGSKLLSLSKRSADVKLAGQEPLERDRPSTYASEAEASEITSALEDDMRFITEHGIKAVVVSATNPLDRIFLLAYIHDRLPNIRLVAEDADELMVNHPHFIDLTGTIVVSSLPTVPEFAAVKDRKPSSISFASVAAEEQFLSTALLLDTTWKPDDKEFASTWPISIVGERGFQLVPYNNPMNKLQGMTAIFGDDTKNKGNDIKDALPSSNDGVALEVAAPNRTPRVFIAFSIGIFLLTSTHLVMLLNSSNAWFRKSFCKLRGQMLEEDRFLPKMAYLKQPNDKVRADGRAFNLLGLNSQVLLLNLLVITVNPALNPFGRELLGLRLIAAVAWLMGAAVISIWVVDWWNSKASREERKEKILGKEYREELSEKLAAIFFFLLTFWYLFCSIVFFILWRSQATAEWRRVLNLDDGLSPIVPIAAILLAWALWAWLQLRRVKWTAIRKMNLMMHTQRPEFSKKSLQRQICDDMLDIHEKIEPATIGLPRVFFILLFSGLGAWWQWGSLRGLEPYLFWRTAHAGGDLAQGFANVLRLFLYVFFPPSFEWWFGIWGFIMLLLTVLQTAFQLWEIWTSLERLLRRLDATRMKDAFASIGEDDRVHIKLWDLGKPQMRFNEMALIVESLKKMGCLNEASAAHIALTEYQNADLEGRQPTQSERNGLNITLNVRMKEALDALPDYAATTLPSYTNSPVWHRYSDTGSEGSHSRELDRYLALRLATLIRYVLLQLRNLMWFVVYGFFLAVVSVTFYPFQGGKNLSDMLAVIFIIVLILMAAMVTQVMRNPMLKRLEDSGSNSASILQASIHLLSVGGLPVLALLAWQFPWIGQMAFSWLRPLFSAFR